MKIIGTKLKMTQIWKDEKAIPITPVRYELQKEAPSIKVGDLIKVSGTSKGRGFAGVVKRHGFHGGPKTHGQKNRHRAPGSIGSTAAQRVIPGKRMAGHMGNVRVTIKNLKVADFKPEENLVLLKGAAPGHVGARLELTTNN